ncbi:MAG: DUF3810 domain-containing protein [Thermoflavifilum sp.]|nr:DUF3810 domain-containing protein [Thermoflavifilum sp.]
MQKNQILNKSKQHSLPLIIGVSYLILIACWWLAWLWFPTFRHVWPQFTPVIWYAQRYFIGQLPFSLGDWLYLLAILWAAIQIYIFIRSSIPGQRWLLSARKLLVRFVVVAIVGYGWFQMSWGFGYMIHRIQTDFHLSLQPYSLSQLKSLTEWLATETNAHYVCVHDSQATQPFFRKTIIPGAIEAYDSLQAFYPEMHYRAPSIKRSLFGKLMNYMGIEGYYNPFTAEAQVNIDIPPMLLPFVTCHEIAHQLGYTQEYAANFVGFLAATHARDSFFRYSAYLNMLLYGIHSLQRHHQRDTAWIHHIWNSLLPGVQHDILAIYAYENAYRGPVDRLTAITYDLFLKMNHQPKGIRSYNEVLALLIQYQQRQWLRHTGNLQHIGRQMFVYGNAASIDHYIARRNETAFF